MPAAPLSPARVWRQWRYYGFIVPSLLLIGVFAYFPASSALYHAFFDWQGGDMKEFVGWDNFLRAFRDPVFWQSFGLIMILVLANLVKMAPSILVAVLIHRLRSDRWQYWYRVLVVLPMVVPGLVSLFIWKFFFDPNLGPLSAFVEASGLKGVLVWLDQLFGWNVFFANAPIGWLSQPGLIAPSLILWGFPWIGTAGVLIYLAGLQAIDKELYEAAELDGAGPWRRFWSIEAPLILTQIRLTVILMVIGTLQGYGTMYLLLGDNGGPGGAGMVPGLWMFNRAFVAGEFGYACALGLILFFIILGLTWVNNRYLRVAK